MICTIVSDGSELIPGKNNEKEQPYIGMKEKLREIIWQLYREGYDEFNLNCEYGVPLWAAEIICGLKMYNDVSLYIYMPYEEQASYWTEEQRDRYFAVHEKSDDVQMFDTAYSEDSYTQTDYEMVCESDLLCVFANGDKTLYAQEAAKEESVEVRVYNLLK